MMTELFFWSLCALVLLEKLYVSTATIEPLDSCAVLVNGQLINLQPLGEGLPLGLTSQFGAGNDVWNYTYRPCFTFNMPHYPSQGFGDKCRSVAFCKYGREGSRQYYYSMGLQESIKFLVDVEQFESEKVSSVKIVLEGNQSLSNKKTYIQLLCDSSRTRVEDALFRILDDKQGLGDVTAELHHMCCCPDGCPQALSSLRQPQLVLNDTNNTTVPDRAILAKKSDKLNADRTKVLIVVGVNIGVFLLAGLVGLTCYNKRAVQHDFYTKVPGIKTVPEPTAWQLTEAMDMEKASASTPLTSVPTIEPHLTLEPKVSVRDKYRDGAPQISRRKSFCFPVLEHSVIPEECITLGQRLGGGMFGDTYIGQWTSVTVAVKRVTLSVHKYQLDNEHVLHMQEQVAFLSTQRHRNIVSVLGFCSESRHPYIISEFISGQVVKDFIRNTSNHITWPDRVKMLAQIADGMAFLHSTSPPILHRDLRCGNLFITDNDVIRICDFGVVNITQPLRSSCTTEDCCCQGKYSACPPSIAWTAPEVLKHPNSTEEDGYITMAADVYSFGIIMWEIVMCDDPYMEMNTAQEVMTYVMEGGRPEMPNSVLVLQPYQDVMNVCWQAIPEERYTFKEVTVHLKELLYQAKHFQKMLATRQSRSRKSSNSNSISRLASSIERSLGLSTTEISPDTKTVSMSEDVTVMSS